MPDQIRSPSFFCCLSYLNEKAKKVFSCYFYFNHYEQFYYVCQRCNFALLFPSVSSPSKASVVTVWFVEIPALLPGSNMNSTTKPQA